MVLADLALMSGAQLFIQEDIGLSDEQIEVLAGSINVFMLVSILAAGWVHYRKPESYRVSSCLPSVDFRELGKIKALGKELICRVPKKYTRQRAYLPSAKKNTLGKLACLPSVFF